MTQDPLIAAAADRRRPYQTKVILIVAGDIIRFSFCSEHKTAGFINGQSLHRSSQTPQLPIKGDCTPGTLIVNCCLVSSCLCCCTVQPTDLVNLSRQAFVSATAWHPFATPCDLRCLHPRHYLNQRHATFGLARRSHKQ